MQNTAQIALSEQQIICEGIWNLANLESLQKKFAALRLPKQGALEVNGAGIAHMDFAGALFIKQLSDTVRKKGLQVNLVQFSESAQNLLSTIDKKKENFNSYKPLVSPGWLEGIGRSAHLQIKEFLTFLEFIGKLTLEFLRIVASPRHIRWNSLAGSMDSTGYTALPIIGLLSFMIGVVLAYQMGNQLRNYGANVFIVDLLGLSVLREFGPLLTAIMIAGRTGSAFTAQLGLMKANQEIDALDTMGITPAEILLLPRILGLVIVLPLLTMWADIFGVFGGMFMANNMLGVSWPDFLIRFRQQVPLSALLIGLGKSPVFAFIIASIGCFKGIQVRGSAESIGTNTTKSVVLSIFFIIVADAIFSIIFSKLHI